MRDEQVPDVWITICKMLDRAAYLEKYIDLRSRYNTNHLEKDRAAEELAARKNQTANWFYAKRTFVEYRDMLSRYAQSPAASDSVREYHKMLSKIVDDEATKALEDCLTQAVDTETNK